jgi:hypothetical protein
MPKLHPMRKSKADREADETRYSIPATAEDGDHDGVSVNLDHHHLKNMGLDAGKMKHGDRVEFSGEGHVEHAEVQSGEHGDRHSARIRLSRAGMEHEGEEPARERENLRNEIETIHGKAEEAREKRSEARGARTAKSGEKVPEKAGG